MNKLLNRNRGFQIAILVGLLGGIVFQLITKSHLVDSPNYTFFFKSFAQFVSNHPIIGKSIIFAVLIIQLIFLQSYFWRNDFVAKKSFFPSIYYLVLLLCSNAIVEITPIFFTTLAFIICLSFDLQTHQTKVKNNVFFAGVIIALFSYFDIAISLITLLIISSLIINQFTKLKEIFILFLGFLITHIYVITYCFFTHNLEFFISQLQQIQWFGVFRFDFQFTYIKTISLIIITLLYLYFIIRTKVQSESKVVVQRKRILTLNVISVIWITAVFINSSCIPISKGYFFVPFSLYLGILSQDRSKFLINEIVTCLTIVCLCL